MEEWAPKAQDIWLQLEKVVEDMKLARDTLQAKKDDVAKKLRTLAGASASDAERDEAEAAALKKAPLLRGEYGALLLRPCVAVFGRARVLVVLRGLLRGIFKSRPEPM